MGLSSSFKKEKRNTCCSMTQRHVQRVGFGTHVNLSARRRGPSCSAGCPPPLLVLPTPRGSQRFSGASRCSPHAIPSAKDDSSSHALPLRIIPLRSSQPRPLNLSRACNSLPSTALSATHTHHAPLPLWRCPQHRVVVMFRDARLAIMS